MSFPLKLAEETFPAKISILSSLSKSPDVGPKIIKLNLQIHDFIQSKLHTFSKLNCFYVAKIFHLLCY